MDFVAANRWRAFAFASVVLGLDAAAWCQPRSIDQHQTSIQLEFSAPEPCAQIDHFIGGVRRRSARIRFEPTAAKRLTVSIRGQDANWLGRASFAQPREPLLSREINARTCDEVVDGLALVTVMVLDPEAFRRPEEQARADSPPASAATPAPKPSPALVAAKPNVPLRTDTESTPQGRLRYGVAGVFGAIVGPAPRAMAGFGAALHVGWVPQHGVWAPEARLMFIHYSLDDYAATDGTADFALDAFTLGICPIELRVASLGVHPCLESSLGQLVAAGARTFVPTTERLLWADVGVQLPLLWNPVGRVGVFIMPAIGMALKRYAFSFAPHQFYQQSGLLISATAGIGLQID